MSDTGSQHSGMGLVPVAPQGQMELASTSVPGVTGQLQGAQTPTYEQLLRFYVEQTHKPVQSDPRVLSYEDLHEYYLTFFERPMAPLPPFSEDVYLTEDEVVTKEEAKEAFASVQDSFASVGAEQGKIKEGLHGLASKVDEVQSKAAEDVAALAQAADEAFS